ncbi:cytidine deaminase [Thalassotalea euphylliae]|uniref:cytidine deaminase n=1 Tax=Thalassotalea euphylliae TaxID=1655234 RepID=UPI00363B7E07
MKKSNWGELKDRAKLGYDNAYAPYSQFKVGAALQVGNGSVYHGCNVENASYGLTVCAERNAIAQAVIDGQQDITALVVYTEQDKLTPPCGACRQVIVEFMEQDATVKAVNHKGEEISWQVKDLLPNAFTPKDLK